MRKSVEFNYKNINKNIDVIDYRKILKPSVLFNIPLTFTDGSSINVDPFSFQLNLIKTEKEQTYTITTNQNGLIIFIEHLNSMFIFPFYEKKENQKIVLFDNKEGETEFISLAIESVD